MADSQEIEAFQRRLRHYKWHVILLALGGVLFVIGMVSLAWLGRTQFTPAALCLLGAAHRSWVGNRAMSILGRSIRYDAYAPMTPGQTKFHARSVAVGLTVIAGLLFWADYTIWDANRESLTDHPRR